MKVLKFGGTSVKGAQRLQVVKDIVVDNISENESIYIILSAFGGVTDMLIDMTNLAKDNKAYQGLLETFKTRVNSIAEELLSEHLYQSIKSDLEENHNILDNLLSGVKLIHEASKKTKDYILSFGERNCAFVFAHYLSDLGYNAEYIDARKYIKTDDVHGEARVNFNETNKLIQERLSEKNKAYVITGFISSDISSGRTTTLGRGGSDYTAAIVASAIDAKILEIWTDVDGVLTTDPRKVKEAYPIDELSYAEALEMSHFGAKVLYSPTIRPLRQKGIPLKIKNTFNPKHPGTLIHKSMNKEGKSISGLSAIENVGLVTIEGTGLQGVFGIASRFFKTLSRAHINIIMITQASSEHSITVAILDKDCSNAVSRLTEEFSFEIERKLIDPIKINHENAIIAIIGENMKNSPGISGKLFQTLGAKGINIEAIAQGSSELNISFSIKQSNITKALNAVHNAFFLSEYKKPSLNIYMIGTGLIGHTLLQLIQDNKDVFNKSLSFDICVYGLSNSKTMLISKEKIDLNDYQKSLKSSDLSSDIEEFVNTMISHNHSRSVFIDATANSRVATIYPKILNNKIAISTPNKIALSGTLNEYKEVKSAAINNHIPFGYEMTVGAGLPVISPLRNMIESGDKVLSIEAVLSGSLSYIFNQFSSETKFHDVVKDAQERGYTEPDPREDLSGRDVKRKLLILARESGFDLEPEDVDIINFLPSDTVKNASVSDFYQLIKKEYKFFERLIKMAESEDKKLRYIASLNNNKGEISLQSIDSTSPFYSLSGSDNMIVITTKRYKNNPLIIRGPGAGAEVTAAGILSEIITIGKIL